MWRFFLQRVRHLLDYAAPYRSLTPDISLEHSRSLSIGVSHNDKCDRDFGTGSRLKLEVLICNVLAGELHPD